MKPEMLESLRALLGSWEAVAKTVFTNPYHNQRYLDSLYGRPWTDEFKAEAFSLILSPLNGKAYKRRMEALSYRQNLMIEKEHAKIMATFRATPPWHNDKLKNDRRYMKDNPATSKRTRQRMKRKAHTPV